MAIIPEGNNASIRVAEKAGYKQEAFYTRSGSFLGVTTSTATAIFERISSRKTLK